jgi:hypothetical protein
VLILSFFNSEHLFGGLSLSEVDQFAISVLIRFKRLCSLLKWLRYSIGRVTTLELVGERILCEIYPGLIGIVRQGFGDELIVRRGRCCRGHDVWRWRWYVARLLIRVMWSTVDDSLRDRLRVYSLC